VKSTLQGAVTDARKEVNEHEAVESAGLDARTGDGIPRRIYHHGAYEGRSRPLLLGDGVHHDTADRLLGSVQTVPEVVARY
jgi:hypothetical protein